MCKFAFRPPLVALSVYMYRESTSRDPASALFWYITEHSMTNIYWVAIYRLLILSNLVHYTRKKCFFSLHKIHFWKVERKSNGFAWISAEPLLDPLLNMHTASHMSVIPAIHEINAQREVFWQQVGKFLFKSIIALYFSLPSQHSTK